VPTRQARNRSEDHADATSNATESPDVGPSESRSLRTDSVIRFQVRGLPIPQGSHRSYLVNGRPVITTSAKGLATWRRLVADVAQQFAPDEPWQGPVGIELDFGIPKPKSAPKRRRVWPDKRPDIDKLSRAVFDALTQVIFADDSQVVFLRASKDYGPPGVHVEVHRVHDSELVGD